MIPSSRLRGMFQVESALHGSGLLARTPGTRFDDDTASAIGQGQQRLNRDHGTAVGRKPLKIDSLINPDGPTQTATRGLARQVADQWRGFEQRRKPVVPTPNVSKPGLPKPQRPSVTPVAENPFTADIKRLQDALTADQAGELTRLADGLSKTRTPGAIASDISEAIKTDGLKAVAEFQVVRDRLKEIGTPDQIRALDEAVLQQLSPKAQRQVREAMGGKSGISTRTEETLLGGAGKDGLSKNQSAEIEAPIAGTDFQKVINGTPDSLKKEREAAQLRIEKIDQRKRSADMGVRPPGKSYARRSDETLEEFNIRLGGSMLKPLKKGDLLAMYRLRDTLISHMPKDADGIIASKQIVRLENYVRPNTPPAPESVQKEYQEWKRYSPDGLPYDYSENFGNQWYVAKDGRLHERNEANFDKASGTLILEYFNRVIRGHEGRILNEMPEEQRTQVWGELVSEFGEKIKEMQRDRFKRLPMGGGGRK